jgi:ATP-binding cassette subfamily B protein
MIRLVMHLGPGLGVGLVVWAVANALLPVGLVIVMGRLIGEVPAATRAGFDSTAGRRLVEALVVTSVLLAVVLLLAPLREALSAVIKTRLTYAMQARLMTAVSEPVGIMHLEDPDVLDRIELTQGSLMTTDPADAPSAFAATFSSQLSGWTACIIVAITFHWWLGIPLLIFGVMNRGPIRRQMVIIANSLAGQADVMRRSFYFLHLASRPAASKEIRIFGLSPWTVGNLRSNYLDGMTKVWKSRDRQAFLFLRLAVGMIVVYGVAYGLLADEALSGQISLATAAMLLPMIGLTASAGFVTYDDGALEWALAAFPHLDQLEADLGARSISVSGTRPAAGLPASEIRFDRVGFTYPGATRPVFEHFDLTLQVGRSTAIVGANGAGKTTLVKLLARLHEPDRGRILVDGVSLSEIIPAEWQTTVATVFQDFTRYPVSAADNIGFGAVAHRDDFAGLEIAARRAGALEIVEGLPSGWDTVLSREFPGGVDLSGGEWQRIALARALFAVDHGARLLVLDEPTAWLDARGEADFFDQFLEITRGLTSIVISHRFSTVRKADHICVIDHALVTEEGTHDELVARDGVYAHAFRLQAARFVDSAATDGETS